MHPNHIATNHPNQAGPTGQPVIEPKPNMLGRYLLGAAILLVGGPVAVLCFLIFMAAIVGKLPESGEKTAAGAKTKIDDPVKAFGHLKAVCEGNPIAAATRQIGGNQRYVAFSRSDGNWRLATGRLPDDLRAERIEDAAHIVCLEPETTAAIEDCVFMKRYGVKVAGIPLASVPSGEIVRFPRTQNGMEARVFSAQTGQRVNWGYIRASPPRACDAFVGGTPWASDFAGGSVSDTNIAGWLRKNGSFRKDLAK